MPNKSIETDIIARFIAAYKSKLAELGYNMHICVYGRSKGIRVIIHPYPYPEKKADIKDFFPKEFESYFIDVKE